MMHLTRPLLQLLLFTILALSAARLSAEGSHRPFVSTVFGNNMVVQRDKPNTIWGWTTPGAKVQVELGSIRSESTAGADGYWRVKYAPPPVGGPYQMKVTGSETVTFSNILVGDVWICSGQSNMAFGLKGAAGGAEAIKAADHPKIRLFSVQQQSGYSAKASLSGLWKECTPETIAERNGFSAVAYFFARRLQQDVDVPIGLIQSAVGGSPIESWMSPQALEAFSEFAPALEQIARLRDVKAPEYGNYIAHWYDEYEIGTKNGQNWATENPNLSDWKKTRIPGGFSDLGVPEHPAVVWFTREVTLPDPLPAGTSKIKLGVVEKMDTTWINGVWIGASSWVENPRAYNIPPHALRPGKNRVTVRVFKLKPDGGFQSPAENLRIELGDGTNVPLAGEWLAKLSVDARSPHPLPLGFENYPTMPTVLYHGMIAPFVPMSIAGALWYQGEANFTRAHQYRSLLPALVEDWRARFEQADASFFVVSLPAFMQRKSIPGDDAWAELRDAQLSSLHGFEKVGVAVTADTGDANDIHPTEKRIVGERVALIALAKHYGINIPYSGPRFASAGKTGNSMTVKFTDISGSLVAKDGQLLGFSIAGDDRRWHRAEAKIQRDTVVVSSPSVAKPVAVRYGWEANPEISLYDSAGLPAAPFRTDDWRLSTEPKGASE